MIRQTLLGLGAAELLVTACSPGAPPSEAVAVEPLGAVQAEQEATQEQQDLRRRVSSLAAEGDFAAIAKVLESVSARQDYEPGGGTAGVAELGAPLGTAATPVSLQQETNEFWEAIQGCGLYPQETRLECVIEIRQVSWYGGPTGAFGSFENVYFCVDWNNNGVFDAAGRLGPLESVGRGNVHMHDESAGQRPPWHYAVYRDFDVPGGLRTDFGGVSTTTRTDGPTRRARAILSWLFAPTGCDYVPWWGTIFDFQVRFDPIR